METLYLCIDVADNYGDMGWTLEFLRQWPIFREYFIVTDNVALLEEFFARSGEIPRQYHMIEKSLYIPKPDTLIILGLHARYDMSIFPPGCQVIRVNYLTYSPWYRDIHQKEHLLSTHARPIIELTYSPLSETGWVWHYPRTTMSRHDWLNNQGLDTSISWKIWIPIFTYWETLSGLDLSRISDNVILFFIGDAPHVEDFWEQIYYFPWLARDEFWSLIDLADVSVLRWEISSLRGLMSGRSLLWDMYKWVWGWNTDDSGCYLEYIDATESMREIHNRLNWWERWTIDDILSVKKSWKPLDVEKIPDFRETLEKTIDSFGFSL